MLDLLNHMSQSGIRGCAPSSVAGHCIVNSSTHQSYLEGLLKHRLLRFTPEFSDSVSLKQGLRFCISFLSTREIYFKIETYIH